MNRPPGQTSRRSLHFRLIFWLLAILAACLAIGGLVVVGLIGEAWIGAGYRFQHGFVALDYDFALLATGAVLAAIMIAGLLLRFSGWTGAARASVVLAIFALILVGSVYPMFLSDFDEGDVSGKIGLGMSALGAIIIVCLPTFQYWIKGRKQIR